jgi:serine/threonine protein kinase
MLSLDKFVALLERSGLVEPELLSRSVANWKSTASLDELSDAHYCAIALVDRGLVTEWQAKKLLDGRHRGFYLGKYKLLDHLGSGGMSSVYLAEHMLMQRRVAIKVLPQNRVTDAAYLARFQLEAQAAAALDHANIVRAYDLDSDGKVHYLVMEYVDGRDLHALVCQDGPLDYHLAADYIAQAAAGLEHAHHCGMVHRDIKPANLLVDRKQAIKILDMGLAKFTGLSAVAAAVAKDEQVLGTADYLAPEQAVNSSTVDQRADIYALGCTLYFLLTGHPPFVLGTSLERMTAHQQQFPPSILLDRPDAPAGLVAICRRMMEKSPENRYQSAREVREALLAWLDSESVAGKVTASAYASGGGVRTGAGESNANLASPSSTSESDPRSARSSQPRSAAAWTDTETNLNRATIRMSKDALRRSSESSHRLAPGSEVLPVDISRRFGSTPGVRAEGPIPPPVDIPPVPTPRAPLVSIVPSGRAPFDPPHVEPLSIDADLAAVGPLALKRRRARSGAPSPWFSTLVFGALVIGALLLALYALALK